MLSILRALLVLPALLLGAPAFGQDSIETLEVETPPPPCGTQAITIARMQWPSAAILAEIHARLLRAHFGCEVSVQLGDLAATGSSMATTGQPAVAPELWITRIAEVWNSASKGQQVRQAGPSYAEPTFEGWFVPDYVVAGTPDLTGVEALKTHWQVFAAPGAGKGRFVSCPPDWGCAIVNRNLIRANGLDAFFEIVEPANRFELDALIAESVSRKEPILFYYWQPNAVLAQFSFVELSLGAYDREAFLCLGRLACAAPKPTGFPPEPVVSALAEWVFLEAPNVAAYFQRARMPFKEMNALLQALNQPGATVESVADGFVAQRGEIWLPWIGAPQPAE